MALERLDHLGGCLISGPSGAVVTDRGRAVPLAHRTPRAARRLGARLRDAAARGGPGLLVGALSFDPERPSALWMPDRIERHPAVAGVDAGRPPAVWARGVARSVPPADHYRAMVAEAVVAIGNGRLEKVVLARMLEVEAAGLRPRPLLAALARGDRGGRLFAIPDPRRAGAVLVGASPELLVARRGRIALAHPLAGSMPRSADPREDARRGRLLLSSAKDLHEHRLVVEGIAATLAPFCDRLRVPPRPSLVGTGAMWHLASRIAGRLRDGATCALALAFALHPTAAICGTPTAAARRMIGAVEPFERDLYTGAVGWCDAAGDGEWSVAIRCAELTPERLRMYAGAGVVAASRPEAELAETEAKFRTMLTAAGLASDGEGR